MIDQKAFRPAALMLVVALFGSAGCTDRPSTIAVQGHVLWDDGKPVAGASLRFVPAKGTQEAIGTTDKDGAFKLTTGPFDGAVAGEYKVVVTKSAAAQMDIKGEPTSPEDMKKAMQGNFDKSGKGPPKVVDPIPDRYRKEESTPLSCTVESASQKLEFKLDRK